MAYNLSSEGAEQNRNGGYTFPPAYGLPAAPAPAAPAGPAAAVAPAAPVNNTPANSIGLSMITRTGQDTLSPIAAQIESDAAKNGLTAWGYSFLRQLGRTIKPEWLKESSKEWFNKELPNPALPPKEDFVKYVEPLARTSTGGETPFATDRGLNTLRAQYGLDVNSRWKGREAILTRKTPPTGTTPVPAESMPPLTPPLSGGEPATSTTILPPATPAPAGAAPSTFLPPYLQPGAGAGTAGAPGLPAIVPAPTPMPAPLTPLGSPITPFVPQGITPAGSPLTPFVPQAALPGASITGGFAKTAKLLELPFYLRQFGGNYGRS